MERRDGWTRLEAYHEENRLAGPQTEVNATK
jgi:hypothetical protein